MWCSAAIPEAEKSVRPRCEVAEGVQDGVLRLIGRIEADSLVAYGTAARLGVRGRNGYSRARFPVEAEATWSGS